MKGFTLAEVFLWFSIVGLLFGAVLGGSQFIQNSKFRDQMSDLDGIRSSVYQYYDQFKRFPGDLNSDGGFDDDSSVWKDLESHNPALTKKTSPFGSPYVFGFSNILMVEKTKRQGNFVSVDSSEEIARSVD